MLGVIQVWVESRPTNQVKVEEIYVCKTVPIPGHTGLSFSGIKRLVEISSVLKPAFPDDDRIPEGYGAAGHDIPGLANGYGAGK